MRVGQNNNNVNFGMKLKINHPDSKFGLPDDNWFIKPEAWKPAEELAAKICDDKDTAIFEYGKRKIERVGSAGANNYNYPVGLSTFIGGEHNLKVEEATIYSGCDIQIHPVKYLEELLTKMFNAQEADKAKGEGI